MYFWWGILATDIKIRTYGHVFLMGHISILIAMSVLLLRLLFSIIHCVVFLYFFNFFYFLSLSLSLLYFSTSYCVLCLCSLTAFDRQEIKGLLTYLCRKHSLVGSSLYMTSFILSVLFIYDMFKRLNTDTITVVIPICLNTVIRYSQSVRHTVVPWSRMSSGH